MHLFIDSFYHMGEKYRSQLMVRESVAMIAAMWRAERLATKDKDRTKNVGRCPNLTGHVA